VASEGPFQHGNVVKLFACALKKKLRQLVIGNAVSRIMDNRFRDLCNKKA